VEKTLEKEWVNILDVHYGVIFSPHDELCDRRGGQGPPILHGLRCLSLKRKEYGLPCLQTHTCAPESDAGQSRGNNALDTE